MSTYNYPKSYRLLNRKQYKRVYASNKKIVSKFFVVLITENEVLHPRVGVVVTKKAVRKAFARNRIKRIIRESFRYEKNKLPNRDIVIIARAEAKTCINTVLFNELGKMWSKVETKFNKQ